MTVNRAKILLIEGKRSEHPSLLVPLTKKGFLVESVPNGSAALARDAYAAVRRATIFRCGKWDPQFEDVSVLCDFPIVLCRSEWQRIAGWAEQLAAETLAASLAEGPPPDGWATSTVTLSGSTVGVWQGLGLIVLSCLYGLAAMACIVSMALRTRSTKMTLLASRLSASIPTLPVPAKRSSQVLPATSPPRMLNSADLTRSVIGRVESPGTETRRLPRSFPEITRSVPTYAAPFSTANLAARILP